MNRALLGRSLKSSGAEEYYHIMKDTMEKNTSVGYVETDIESWIENTFISDRMKNEIHTAHHKIRVLKTPTVHDKLCKIISDIDDTCVITQTSSYKTYVNSKNFIANIKIDSNSITANMIGEDKILLEIIDKISSSFDVVSNKIDWITSTDMNSTSVPMIRPKGIHDSSYPFIKEGVDNFVNSFLNSSECILVLIGPPGTGKSNFIKYLISESSRDAIVTYDPKIMQSDSMFAMFVEGNYGSLIMEDADTFLSARSTGNEMMSKLLNVSDGIVSMAGKKIIFSTNLENMNDVDPALLRPGRCFAVLQFRDMKYDESVAFLKHHEIDSWQPEKDKTYSLASLYNQTKRTRSVEEKRKVGFL
jgi:ATP-dependent 26S proteasome regulatory subunit